MNNRTASIFITGLAGFGAIGFSAYGAYHDMSGWGWFFVAGVSLVAIAAELGEKNSRS
jgi:hypothetical protein